MDGIFGVLANVVWTSYGPCAVDGFELTRARLRRRGPVAVYGIDKFPRMVDYVVPAGVRIADADRVRLGAHLAAGTTVMHEGFVNFNAGTLGTSMVEGRISAGVVVGDGSDVGGGASIMGTLSGGGKEVISVGKRCLLGANSGLGISLGDDCVVEAGLYVTGGTKVTTSDGQTVKARELSGANNLLFRRNSLSGAVEVVKPRRQRHHAQRGTARQLTASRGSPASTRSIATPWPGTVCSMSPVVVASACAHRSRTAEAVGRAQADRRRVGADRDRARVGVEQRHRDRAVGQRLHDHPAIAGQRAALNQQRILIDGDHVAVGQDVAGLLGHRPDVVAREQWRGQHGPQREVRALLGVGQIGPLRAERHRGMGGRRTAAHGMPTTSMSGSFTWVGPAARRHRACGGRTPG